MTWKKWTVGIIVTVVFSLLTAGAGLSQGMSWQAFTAVLCTALLTNLGAYLMKHPVEAVGDEEGEHSTFNIQRSTPKDQGGNMPVWILTAVLALGMMGCATKFIDKVAQTRAAAAKGGYRTVAEFNGWYHERTNALRGTTPALEQSRLKVYTLSSNLSLSLLTLEAVEDAYRLAPTNQAPVVSAVDAVAGQASNLVNTVNTLRKGNAP
jgi:hypothetical protein